MRNLSDWMETKFEQDGCGHWRASRSEVPVTSRLIVDLVAAAYAKAIEAHASGRLADLGCGKVPLYGMYRDKVVDIVCIDWSCSLHGATHVDFYADLNEPLRITHDSFDTVIAMDVIEHLHTPQALFASAARTLASGGKLIIGVPFLYWIHEAPHDYYRYTRFALEKLSADAGLAIVSLDPFGGAPDVLADIATKAVGSRPRLARLVHGLCRALLALPSVTKLSAATRDAMPMGYVLVAQKF